VSRVKQPHRGFSFLYSKKITAFMRLIQNSAPTLDDTIRGRTMMCAQSRPLSLKATIMRSSHARASRFLCTCVCACACVYVCICVCVA